MFKAWSREETSRFLWYAIVLLVIQFPFVSIYFKHKHNLTLIPNRDNYYDSLALVFQTKFNRIFTNGDSVSKHDAIKKLTSNFVDELYQNKILLMTKNDMNLATEDLEYRIRQYLEENSLYDASTQAVDLTALSNYITENNNTLSTNLIKHHYKNLSVCPEVPPKLVGYLNIDLEIEQPTEAQLDSRFKQAFLPGGHYLPECEPKSKVAIILPFRNRSEHLMYFLHYMHPILQRQQLEYKIYVINQLGESPFNRAILLNIGFVESIRDYPDWGCFTFHDVDIVLENDNLLYRCSERPRHMSVAVDKFNYKLPYSQIFGGVTSVTKDHYLTLNGYSNSFNGWGGEDDDMFRRLYLAQLDIQRPDPKFARYKMFKHKRDSENQPNPNRWKLLRSVRKRWKLDGLNSLLPLYTVESIEHHVSYTLINVKVEINEFSKAVQL